MVNCVVYVERIEQSGSGDIVDLVSFREQRSFKFVHLPSQAPGASLAVFAHSQGTLRLITKQSLGLGRGETIHF